MLTGIVFGFTYSFHGKIIPTTVSKVLSFPVFHDFFCGILLKYKLERKILVFDVILFEEKFTGWILPDWLFSGTSSLLPKFGEYRISLVKE